MTACVLKWYLADQLQSLVVLSLVGNTDRFDPADDSQVHIQNEGRVLNGHTNMNTLVQMERATALLIIEQTFSTLMKYSL